MKNFKLKNSLSIKLLKVVFLVYFLVTFFTLGMQIYIQYENTKITINNEISSIETKFKNSLSAAIWNFNVEEINAILEGIKNNHYISGVALLDKNGITMNTKGKTGINNHLKYTFLINRNYKQKEYYIGKVEIYSDPRIIYEKFKENISFLLKNIILGFFVLSILLIIIFNKYLTKPLTELSNSLQELDLDNIQNCELLKEKIDLSKKNKNELELFKDNFIVILNKIAASSSQLNSLNETLEKKVTQRTIKLEEERNKIKSFLDAAMEAIFISKEGRCIDVNQSAVNIFGYKNKEEMIGKKLIEFVAPESRDLVKEKLKLNDASPYEGTVMKKDNTTFMAYIRGIDTQHENIRISSVIDITHLKQLESQSKLAAMGEMIGNIAHQWRQPLSIISTSATGMKLKKEMNILEDRDIDTACDHINENAQYLSQTINDFTNFIKGDTKPVRFDLKNDTDSFIKLVNSTIKNYNLNVILDLKEHIQIQGYPNELIQCFINIFNNSKDAFVQNNINEDERYIFIAQRITGKFVEISFKDNAGGIPENIMPKIFEPYFTTKHKSQGTGLGLHMSYNLIVNHMKGTLEVFNKEYEFNGKEYKGAEFVIKLPLS